MQVSPKDESVGKISDQELELLRTHNTHINQLKFQIGEMECAKMRMLMDIDELKQGLMVMEQQIVKQYGETAKVNLQTGNVTVAPKTSNLVTK